MNNKAKKIIENELKEKTGKLNLSYCELDRIPKEVENMVWLTSLWLNDNQITKMEHLSGLSGLSLLDLSSNRITKIEDIEYLSNLTSIKLYINQVTKIEGLNGLSSLTSLDLDNNQIIKLEGLSGLTNLTNFLVSSNRITTLEGLGSLHLLTSLSVNGNQLTKIGGLASLSGLVSLSLSGNQIKKIEGLSGLSSITRLYLSNNDITKLEGLNTLSSLTTIYLSNNNITKLEGLDSLSNLVGLYLQKNKISKLEGLDSLSNLTGLYLQENQIVRLEGLDSLSSLTELYLHKNQIGKLEGLDSLSNLTGLYLQENHIGKLEGLDSLSNLTGLYLQENHIGKLEGLDALTSLLELDLSDNQINTLEGLNALSSLIELYLSSNQITKLEGLEALSSLNGLYLYGNQITKLEGLETLTNLTWLYLQKNQIKKLEGLRALSNLRILDFENNPISELPNEYKDFLGSLSFLDLKGTKIEDLSFFYDEIKNGKRILWEDIENLRGHAYNKKDYFQYTSVRRTYHVKRGVNVKECNELDAALIAAIQDGRDALLAYIDEPKERLFEARVLVLGEPRAGKTTLRRKLLDVCSTMPTVQESTKAFEIEVASYECDIELQEKKEKLRYNLWDFGGQDYYRLLHQLFVTEQSVYIIVVDTDRNKNEEEIGFWLDTIEQLGKDDKQNYGPVILLQNPKNNRPGGTFTDLKKRYHFWQQTEDFVINLNALNEKEVDSFNNNELVRFRDFEGYLWRSFRRLSHVGKEIPIKWIAVREALLAEKENWISVERFKELCSHNAIKNKDEQISLLNIFRQLGYLLHYKNTALKGMVILNREWVTDALYRVLDDPIVENNKGWFKKENAESIWFEEKYENRTDELLALMEEFKLCYQNPIIKKYIVPSKLSSSVENLPQWDETNNVRLRLRYDWMPKALAIQLIVSLHEYIIPLESGEQWIWRKGAVLDGKQLELKDVQVRIMDEYEDRRIAIDARGRHSEDIIRVIMKKWREVNEPYKDKVEVTPIILCPCQQCSEQKRPTNFEYQDVLRAKEKGKPQYCNKSFESLEASDILKGIYDETTVLLDSLTDKKKEHSIVLGFIRADELDKAISVISSPEYNALFERRLKEWNRNNELGVFSSEQKTQTRIDLAKDLVDYFTSDRPIEHHKFDQLGEKSQTMMNGHTYATVRENKDSDQAILSKEKEQPSVQVIINNTNETNPLVKPEIVKKATRSDDELSSVNRVYQQWWFIRVVGAIVGGAIVAYFAYKYWQFHFGDTWLAVTSSGSAILLMRNPKRVYLRWAGYCILAIASVNILSQIDIAFNITDTTEKARPWDLFFKLGFGQTPLISIIFGALAVVLFVLHYRTSKESF